jgi:hypothetical protein
MGEEGIKKKGRRKGCGAIYRARAPTSLAPLSIGVGVGGRALLPNKSAYSDDALLRQHDVKCLPNTEAVGGCRGSRRATIALSPY